MPTCICQCRSGSGTAAKAENNGCFVCRFACYSSLSPKPEAKLNAGTTTRPRGEVGQGHRPNALHRLSRVYHCVQVGKPGPALSHAHLRKTCRRRSFPPGAPGASGDALQSMRARTLCYCLSHHRHVQARRRHRRFRQVDLYWLQSLHGCLPL